MVLKQDNRTLSNRKPGGGAQQLRATYPVAVEPKTVVKQTGNVA